MSTCILRSTHYRKLPTRMLMKKGLKTRVPPSWCNSILECEINGKTASKAVGMCLCGRVLSHVVETIGPPAAELHVKALFPRPPSSWLKTSLFHMKEMLGGFSLTLSFPYPHRHCICSCVVIFHKKSIKSLLFSILKLLMWHDSPFSLFFFFFFESFSFTQCGYCYVKMLK